MHTRFVCTIIRCIHDSYVRGMYEVHGPVCTMFMYRYLRGSCTSMYVRTSCTGITAHQHAPINHITPQWYQCQGLCSPWHRPTAPRCPHATCRSSIPPTWWQRPSSSRRYFINKLINQISKWLLRLVLILKIGVNKSKFWKIKIQVSRTYVQIYTTKTGGDHFAFPKVKKQSDRDVP